MLAVFKCPEMLRTLLALGLALAASTCLIFADVPQPSHAFSMCFASARPHTRGTHSRLVLHSQAPNATRPRLPTQLEAARPRLPMQVQADVRRHDRILVELLSALLQTDDVALLERDARAMGVAYLDTNFSMCRRPLLLRQSVREIMGRHDIPFAPLERKWTPVARNHSVHDTPPSGFLDEDA
jgi:hypothetical protein